MTSETKHFIQLSDIVALCFTCKHCGISLHLGLDKFQPGVLHNCPNCHRDWAAVRMDTPGIGRNYESNFSQFVGAIHDLEKLTGDTSPVGFGVSLEIKQPQ
jgi:hypothetical protein